MKIHQRWKKWQRSNWKTRSGWIKICQTCQGAKKKKVTKVWAYISITKIRSLNRKNRTCTDSPETGKAGKQKIKRCSVVHPWAVYPIRGKGLSYRGESVPLSSALSKLVISNTGIHPGQTWVLPSQVLLQGCSPVTRRVCGWKSRQARGRCSLGRHKNTASPPGVSL